MSRFTVKRRRGFTLIEIMIVVLIIGILLAIAIPNFMRARETSRAKSCCANLRQIETAKEQYAMDEKLSDGGIIPNDGADLWAEGAYIKEEPKCPSDGVYTVAPIGTPASCDGNPTGAVAGDYNYHGL
ncbi:MAG: prepilin-type N-terminal cleavage/methylation domain-containing protein [Armatimonadota bacterium]